MFRTIVKSTLTDALIDVWDKNTRHYSCESDKETYHRSGVTDKVH